MRRFGVDGLRLSARNLLERLREHRGCGRQSMQIRGRGREVQRETVGTMPTRISTISPMPFCPSFEPCAKLTPVQVSTSKARIQIGGGFSPSGAWYSAGLRSRALAASSSSAGRDEAEQRREDQRLDRVLPPWPN